MSKGETPVGYQMGDPEEADRLFTRRRSFAEYWKYFVARFNDVHAFGYNFAGSEQIWMKFGELRAYCLELALTNFGRDPRRSESERPCGSFFFVSDIAIFVLKRDVKLQLTNCGSFVFFVRTARLSISGSARFHEICTQDVVLWRGESFQNNFLKICP